MDRLLSPLLGPTFLLSIEARVSSGHRVLFAAYGVVHTSVDIMYPTSALRKIVNRPSYTDDRATV